MARPLPVLAGLAAGLGLVRLAARRRRAASAAGADPRAAELRRRLDEARELEADRAEEESAEVPVDRAVPPPTEKRRREVHERGRAAADRMRPGEGGDES